MGGDVIQIKCEGSRMAQLASLETIQGDLKELSEGNYAKLRTRIETDGFDAPIFVWGNRILDGTQRKRVVEKMIEDGWTLPDGLVPVCDIHAETLDEAKRRLLGYVSQYGKLSTDGLYEFLHEFDEMPSLDTLDLPDFDMEAFKTGFLGDEIPEGEMAGLPDGDKAPFQQMTFTLHDDQADIVKRAIQAAKDAGPFVDSPNENSNGNALNRIAEAYIGQG